MLKVANSPIYGQRSRISSVRRAITVLGARSLRNIALCAATHACVSRSRLGSFDLTRFWEASIQRACAARLLTAHDETLDVDPAEAFTASLLQDLGVVALIMRQPEVGERWNTLARLPPEPRREQERTLCGHSHDELAVELSTAWGLAPELAIPMRYHHEPHRAPAVGRDRAQLAHDAEVLASVLSTSDPKLALAAAREMIDCRAGVNVTAEALLSELPSVVDDAARALGLAIDAQPSLQEILVDANRGLSELNLSYEEVLQRLERALEEKEHLARALQARNRELEQLSLTDELTGLPNRRAFWGRAVYELNRIARSGEGLCVAMGDLDHFKSVNDGHGHDFGDRVLEAVAGSLSNAVRATDMVARIGGEEFAIILPGTELQGGLVAARKLNLAIQAMELTTPGVSSVPPSPSGSPASWVPTRAPSTPTT